MDLKIFTGASNVGLAEDIVYAVSSGALELGETEIKIFPDGELYFRYLENIRGSDVFIIQSTNQPARNDEELRMMIHTAKAASAGRVTAVIPYFGYARQDRKERSRAPVSAIRKVQELVAVGMDRLLVVDAHSSAVENAALALGKNCDHLWARSEVVRFLKSDEFFLEFKQEGLVIAAPDLNAGKFARGYAESLDISAPLVLIEKRRDVQSGDTSIINVIGDVRGKNVLIVDDMIDTAGTLCDASRAFVKQGAKRVWAVATHGVFSGSAIERINKSSIEQVFVTDSISGNIGRHPKIRIVSIAPLLGEAIWRIHKNESVSSLFTEEGEMSRNTYDALCWGCNISFSTSGLFLCRECSELGVLNTDPLKKAMADKTIRSPREAPGFVRIKGAYNRYRTFLSCNNREPISYEEIAAHIKDCKKCAAYIMGKESTPI
ncbi:MAG: hypothetical protein A3B96_01415 [Candidatus Spechtbacteria bacterium RIFCSPHIGHO2_02_FULL_43_15b]|nr:MAG: hypothetical protein A3B96_01415 [Candidatus Spechtbacteria bacterium RIFCSPHIGHO2_02_FULL_43_15b]